MYSRQENSDRDTPIYGTVVEPFEIDGVTFNKIVGKARISDIQDQMQIDSFDGRGHSRIIDKSGTYIVDTTPANRSLTSGNLWDRVKKVNSVSEAEQNELKRRVDRRESFRFEYTDNDGEEYCLIFRPMENRGWYFVTQLSKSVIRERQSLIMSINIKMITILSVMLTLLLAAIYFMRRRSIRDRAVAEAKSGFLSNMSHEVRTPLSGLIGLNHLMAQHMDDKEQLQRYLEKSSETSQYLLAVVNDILDMSKLDAGKFELLIEPIFVRDVFLQRLPYAAGQYREPRRRLYCG